MALELSVRAELLSQKTNVQQNLILEIDGIPDIYGAVNVSKLLRYGDEINGTEVAYGDPNIFYGGTIPDDRSKDYISLNRTTKSLTQQLLQDKGGTSSVSNLKVELIDKSQDLSNTFAPGTFVDDILGREARFYLNFISEPGRSGAHPEDSVLLFNGIIQQYDFGAGYVILQLGHPDLLKRQILFQDITTELTADIDAVQTTIAVTSTQGFIAPGDALRSYIQINDELIEYTGLTDTTFTGCSRGQLNTIADSHDLDDSVDSWYRLEGQSIDLALKLMLSNVDNAPFVEGVDATGFVNNGSFNVEGAIFFDGIDVQRTYGIVVGDTVSITGANEAANNGSFTITSIDQTPIGSLVTTDGSLVIENDSPALASFNSKYNVLPEGLQMSPTTVDVAEHELIQLQFGSGIVDQDIYVKEEINGLDFIAEQLYYPNGIYSIPRKGRSSLGITTPPLVGNNAVVISNQNTTNAPRLQMKRSINENFYNAVVYKYNVDSLEDKFLSGKVLQSAASTNRIPKLQNKPLIIEAPGFRKSGDVDAQIERNQRYFIDRYRFGARFVDVDVEYKTGFSVEVGDTVIFDGATLQVTDDNTGNRNFETTLMEVVNKKLNVVNGKVSLSLVDTAYQTSRRYGVISPSSIIRSGATTTTIPLKVSYSTPEGGLERLKWVDYVGQDILIHDQDWTFTELARLESIDISRRDTLVLAAPLSIAPLEDYVVDIPEYPTSTNPREQAFYKNIHVFTNPQAEVDAGISNTSFDVVSGDESLFFVGSFVRVHNFDYTTDSGLEDIQVTDITGTTITVDTDLGFTPASGFEVELIGFPDQGNPYAFI